MLIPSIDLMGGRIVQLQQGERLAVESADIDYWIARFASYPLVQLIDLDAAKGTGDNRAIAARICRALPCQVGGGIRQPADGQRWLDAGARRVILGSTLYDAAGVRPGRAALFAEALGQDRLVAAIDSRGGRVVIDAWRTTLPITPVEAIAALEADVGAFLYTHVDTEGLLTGLDVDTARVLRAATRAPLIVAGGIRSQEEIDRLDAMGLDAVVGMAIYLGRLGSSGSSGSTAPGRATARRT